MSGFSKEKERKEKKKKKKGVLFLSNSFFNSYFISFFFSFFFFVYHMLLLFSLLVQASVVQLLHLCGVGREERDSLKMFTSEHFEK